MLQGRQRGAAGRGGERRGVRARGEGQPDAFPTKVVLGEAVRSDEEAVKAMTKYCGSEEAAAFAVALLKVSAR